MVCAAAAAAAAAAEAHAGGTAIVRLPTLTST
jgi:hypothetical protein